MVERDLALAAYEDQPLHLMHLSARESVAALRRAHATRASRASGEVTPHHLVLTDDAVRSLDPNVKMNPPLRAERRPRRAPRRAARRHDRARSRPTTRRTRGTRRTCRSRRRRSASPGSRRRSRCSTRDLVEPGLLPLETLLERMSAGPARDLRARAAADRGRRAGEPRRCSTSSGAWRGDRGRLPLALGELVAARRERCSGRVVHDVADGAVAHRA